MPIPVYTLGYPPDGSSLGQTKSTIRNNLDGTFETLAVDHINNNGQPGSNPAGYHTVIHEVTQASVSTVTGVNQLFAGIPGTLSVNMTVTPAVPNNGDTQLYSLTGTGVLSQLTGSLASADGYAWIGGVLIQWGNLSVPAGGNAAFEFPVKFPTACFAAYTTTRAVGAFTSGLGIPSQTAVTVYLEGLAVDPQTVYVFAIGN